MRLVQWKTTHNALEKSDLQVQLIISSICHVHSSVKECVHNVYNYCSVVGMRV